MTRNRSIIVRRAVSLTLATAALTAAAVLPALVGADGQTQNAAALAEGTTTTAPPTTAAEDVPLVDGRYFGRLVAAYVAPNELVFDRMSLEVGPAARDAAAADGRDPGEIGDYYIDDSEPSRAGVPVSGAVEVTRVECDTSCAEGADASYDGLTRYLAERPDAAETTYWWVTIEDGEAVRIDEQYFA